MTKDDRESIGFSKGLKQGILSALHGVIAYCEQEIKRIEDIPAPSDHGKSGESV